MESPCEYGIELLGFISQGVSNKVIAGSTLLYGSKNWGPKRKDLSKIQSPEIKVLRCVTVCSILDKIKHEKIKKEIEIESIKSKILNIDNNGMNTS